LDLPPNKEEKKEGVEIGQSLLDRINKWNLETNWALNFKILISLLMFANDNNSIDQGELIKMKRDFVKITDVLDDKDRQYLLYYSGIGIFGTLVQIMQAMGLQFDASIPGKFHKVLKDQKT
jgi:hypothetical protein